jgi:glycosyl transferase family 2
VTSGRRFLAPTPQGAVTPRGQPPGFSIVITAYQAAEFIREAVESALSQTYAPEEVIVVDDGSTDDLTGALEPYRDRIVLIRRELNGGEGAAKDTGAGAAAAEFVVLLDADDVYEPGRLVALAELAHARPDLDLLTTNAYLEVDGRVVGTYYPDIARFPVEDQLHGVLESDSAIFGAAAVRSERLRASGGFDAGRRGASDWECWLRLMLDGARAGLVDEPLARYRLRSDSITAHKPTEWRACLSAVERALEHPRVGPAERVILARSADRYRTWALLAAAEQALRSRSPDARARSLQVVTGRRFGVATRVKALSAAIAPKTAGRFLAARERRSGRSRLTRMLP